MSAPQPLLAGRYRLVRRIAAGGMGVVWEGWDEVLERPVAVKQLRTEVGVTDAEAERAKNRAMREARITAKLHHAHAVPVFDAVKHKGQPCLVMQYVPSTALSAVLRERGPLPAHEVARIGAQIASALAAAHRLGIVHRDVKPGNILIAEDGDALITDFGISHAFGDPTLTSTGLVHGTPAFLAPEVARGVASGFPSDVFSLGSTLYAATEGAPPFGMSSNSIALLHKVAAGRFPPPVRSGVLTPLLLEMLELDPDARPSMADVAVRLANLEDVAAAEADRGERPTVALPVPPLEESREDTGEEQTFPPEGPASEEPVSGPSGAVAAPATGGAAAVPAMGAAAAAAGIDGNPDDTLVLRAWLGETEAAAVLAGLGRREGTPEEGMAPDGQEPHEESAAAAPPEGQSEEDGQFPVEEQAEAGFEPEPVDEQPQPEEPEPEAELGPEAGLEPLAEPEAPEPGPKAPEPAAEPESTQSEPRPASEPVHEHEPVAPELEEQLPAALAPAAQQTQAGAAVVAASAASGSKAGEAESRALTGVHREQEGARPGSSTALGERPTEPRTVEPLPWFAGRRQQSDAVAPVTLPVQGPPRAPSATSATPSHTRGRRDRRLLGVVAAALIAAVLLIGGSLLLAQLGQGDQAGERADRSASPSADPASSPPATPSAEPSPEPSSSPASTAPPPTPEPEPEPEPAPPAPAPTREEQLAQAITGYYALMPGSRDAAWPLMTEDYQINHAGGRAGYDSFWNDISAVSVSDVRGIAPDGAEATVTYVYNDGHVVDEVTAYRLVDEGGVLKIAATDVLSSVTR